MVKKRIERLLIHYIIWPLLIFLNDNIMHYCFGLSLRNNSLNDLKIQLILGRQFIIPLWYLFSMIFLTILFFILSFIFRNNFLFFAQLLSISSYILQYSNKYACLNKYKNNVRLPILDTLSILPLSVIGLNFASSKFIDILKANPKMSLFFSYLFLYFLFKYEIFINLGGYNGIINIFSSLLFFVGFYLLPLEKTNTCIQNFIKQITSYTNGIYCLQGKIIIFVKTKIDRIGGFKSSIISYILLYLISFIGHKIFGKTKLKYLFI